MRTPTPFEFMHWAKAREGATWHLGTSGTPAPGPDAEAAFFAATPDLPAGRSASTGDRFGYAALREAVARAYGAREDGVLVSDGTSLANYAALTAMAGPGDRVLVETPTYPVLAEIPRFHGAVVERLPRRAEDGWQPRLDDVRAALARPGPPLRAVALTRLHNPTGADLDPAFLDGLAALAEANDFHVMLDEVYLDFVDAEPGHRISPRFVTTGSLTKVYGFGGLRIGWVIGDPRVLRPVREFSFYLSVNASSPSQAAALRVLERREELRAGARRRAAAGLAVMDAWIASRADVSWVRPAGGLVGFVRVHRVADTRAFARRILETRGVAVAEGEFFGAPGHLRVGFGVDAPALLGGLERLGAALDEA